MNTEKKSPSFVNYFIGATALLLVMFVPTLNWLDKTYSIDPLKLENKKLSNSDNSKKPDSPADKSVPESEKSLDIPTEKQKNSQTDSTFQADAGEESISILNRPPPRDVKLPRKVCMVTTYDLSLTRGIFASRYTNLEYETCDVDAFNKMSIASAAAQIAPGRDPNKTTKSGPYMTTATKDLSASDKEFLYIGGQRFSETMNIKVSWIEILRDPGFLVGASIIERALYYPLNVKQDMSLFWSPEEPAYILVNPENETYIMTYYSVRLLPGLNRYNLLSLEKLLVLPPGWRFVKTEILKPIWITRGLRSGFTSTITYDNLGNFYIKENLKGFINTKGIYE